MDTDYYRFTLGAFACVCVLDGNVKYRPESFFTNATKEQIDKALRQHDLPLDRITTPYTYLVVDTGAERVLVDMGAGNLSDRAALPAVSQPGAHCQDWEWLALAAQRRRDILRPGK